MGACALLACAGPLRRELRLSQEQVQARVEQAFPLQRRQALIEVTFSDPRVRLEGGDRIGLDLAVRIEAPGAAALHGRMAADAGLAYDAGRGELVLVDTRCTGFDVDGLSSTAQRQLRRAATDVAREYFARIPVYRLDPGDFEQSLARLVLRSVRVRDRQVVVTVGL